MTDHTLLHFIKLITLLAAISGSALTFRKIKYRSNYDDDSLWDLSSWKLTNIEDLQRTAFEMYKLGVDLETARSIPVKTTTIHVQKQSRKKTKRGERDRKSGGGSTTRRLRLQSQPLNQDRGQRQGQNNQEGQENKWNEDAEGMEGELMQYFLAKTGKKQQKQQQMAAGRAMQPYQKASKKLKRRASIVNPQIKPLLDVQRRNRIYTWEDPFSLNCTDPDSETLECPPEDLPQKCDKYNGGTMEECYQMCKISFCCIHDSVSKTQAQSCSQELNCKNWSPCYIVWWKLHDTIGPLSFIRVEQDEPFFNIDFKYILEDTNVGDDEEQDPFYKQLFFHHFDTDDFKGDEYVENPANW